MTKFYDPFRYPSMVKRIDECLIPLRDLLNPDRNNPTFVMTVVLAKSDGSGSMFISSNITHPLDIRSFLLTAADNGGLMQAIRNELLN